MLMPFTPTPIERPARLVAGAIAVISATALALQTSAVIEAVHAQGGPTAYAFWILLGYFTILTNLLVVAALGAYALGRLSPRRMATASLLAAVTLFAVVVGAVYHLLLSGLWIFTGWGWVADIGLHSVVPLLMAGFWLALAPKFRLAWSEALRWAVYPAAYGVYALVRGGVTGWYPYPFLDVARLGMPQVAVNAALFLAAFVLLGLGLIAISRRLARV